MMATDTIRVSGCSLPGNRIRLRVASSWVEDVAGMPLYTKVGVYL